MTADLPLDAALEIARVAAEAAALHPYPPTHTQGDSQ